MADEARGQTSVERSAPVIVGIGASAGGLEVYEQFFDGMPPDSGAGFVVVQHLAPDHASILAELLSKHTTMPVAQVEADVRVEPNHVYLIPPNRTLTLLDGRLRLAEASEAPRVPIDGFFVSLAGELGERAVGVILSGSGSDGALGMQAIKEHGGMTMVQTPESARFDSMPRSAIDTGHVDLVLTVQEMPAALTAHLRLLGVAGASGGLDWTALIAAACEILHQQTGHDFGRYKEATLRRRIARRMDVLGLASAAEYVTRLRGDTVEGARLLAELLINVTQFFRDPDVFEHLGQEIVPKLCEGKTQGDSVRVWVPGCSSGEEAYSIAILLLEHLGTFESPPDVKIFATDIDEEALATARRGRYPEAIAEHVSAARLERFFVKVGSSYQVKKALRAICFFTTHNLVNHPPFSQLDLISCRNTLIYLRSDLQDELLALLHYGLRPGGYLLLGPAESVTARPELFRPVLERQRIFQRREPLVPPVIHFPLGEPRQAGMVQPPSTGEARYATRGFERLLLERYMPASAIVDERGEVLYLAGPVGRYLSPPPGRPTHNLFDLAARDLRAGLRDAVQETLATRRGVVRPGLLAEAPDGVRTVDVSVRRMPELGSDAKVLLVAFEDRGPPVTGAPLGASPASDDPVATRLERELQLTRARLQTTLDDQQASAEQFQTANEELLSMNEELQSTNEELQTSREELQSTNEELSTLTDELRRRIGELDAASNDLRNLFESTHIATIFLDVAMRIKRFTPAAAELFRVRESDLGRPVSEVMPRFTGGDLLGAAREVLRSQKAQEREVHRDEDDRWYVQRLQPYRTVEDEIAGVVVTFVDITDRKRAADLLVEADHRKDEFLAMLAHELRNPLAPVRNAVHLLGHLAVGDPGQARAREVIERQVGHMARIIDDLLDVSRISQHKMRLRRERVDLVEAGPDRGRRRPPDHGGAEPDVRGDAPRRAPGGPGRRHPALPDRGQPAQQRLQVHRSRRRHPHDARSAARGQGGGPRGGRHRHRDGHRDPVAALRHLQPGR